MVRRLLPYIIPFYLLIPGCGLYQDAVRQTNSQWIKKRIPEVEKQLEEKIASHEPCLEISLLEEEIHKLEDNLPLEIQTELELKKDGYDEQHVRSCCPSTLEIIFARYMEDIPAKEISKEIIENGGKYTFARNLLHIFHAELAEITFPQEMQNELKRHGYLSKVRRGSYLDMRMLLADMAEKAKPGIVRLRHKQEGYEHWEPFPPRTTTKWEMGETVQTPTDIFNYFGTDTDIVEVYEIEPSLEKRIRFMYKRAEEKVKNTLSQIHYLSLLATSKYLSWQIEELEKRRGKTQ